MPGIQHGARRDHAVYRGGTYLEHVEMHKVGKGGGYDGKWKIDLIRQINTYPFEVKPPLHTDERQDFGSGRWMQCVGDAGGFQVVNECSGGNYLLDVSGGRIGLFQTGIWIGKIEGKAVTLKFDASNEFEPTLTGEIHHVDGGNLKLVITSPGNGGKYVYSGDVPGVLNMGLKASVTPAEYADKVRWTLPDISGSVLAPDEPTGANVDVSYTKLPAGNQSFGKKVVKAEVEAGMCKLSDEKEVSVFFPRDAVNNPGGTTPNWFYYWSQTSARKGPAKYGARIGLCAAPSDNGREGIIGFYHYISRAQDYLVCDLTRLPGDMDFTAVKIVTRAPLQLGDTKTHGIDTFAVASHHENAHYEHFRDWWFAFNPNPIRASGDHMMSGYNADGDFIPDAAEVPRGLDPNDKYTLKRFDAAIDVDDEEYLSWLAEAAWTVGSADSEYWAKPGKQWRP